MNRGGARELRLAEVGHVYDAQRAPVISDVSLTFRRGEVSALVGPSGSGKSTLLSIVGLLLRPTAGRVVIDGVRDPWRSRAAATADRAELFSWVLQNSACLEARTTIDNVALGPLACGAASVTARRLAAEALSIVGLGDLLSQRASRLSGGELQRMTIARALAHDRSFILADEPTGQLDAKNSEAVVAALRACADADHGVILATHDDAVVACCDRVVAIVNGSAQVS